MFVADAHCDTLFSIAVEGKDPSACAVTEEKLKKGGVGLQTYAMFAGAKGMEGQPYEKGLQMLAAARNLPIPIYRGTLPEQPDAGPHGVISIEGGEMLKGDLRVLHDFHREARIRLIALTWNNVNEIGHPAKEGPEGGLTPFGFELLREMDRLGIYADVSHLNEAGFSDVAMHMTLPPVASHSNFRELCDVPRNLWRWQVKAIIEKRGFIGINFYSAFLRREGKATLEDVLRHIDAIAEMGGVDCLGFGSDFDGITSWPDGLADPSDFPRLIDMLLTRGYTQAQVEGIAGMNLWRLYRNA